MEKTDMFIFSGQSNMQGQTEAAIFENPVEGAEEYRLLSDSLLPLKNPVGENIGELLLASHLRHGSLLPYFAQAYIAESKRKVVAVHAAKGATVAKQWIKRAPEGKERYEILTRKAVAAEKKSGNIDKKYLVWLQGESDALAGTSPEIYAEELIELKNDLKRDLGIDKFMIIEVGYFAANYGKKKYDEAIMRAQEKVCREDPDFLLLTDISKRLSLKERWLNSEAAGHYNNAAMKIIGKAAGKAAAHKTSMDAQKFN